MKHSSATEKFQLENKSFDDRVLHPLNFAEIRTKLESIRLNFKNLQKLL